MINAHLVFRQVFGRGMQRKAFVVELCKAGLGRDPSSPEMAVRDRVKRLRLKGGAGSGGHVFASTAHLNAPGPWRLGFGARAGLPCVPRLRSAHPPGVLGSKVHPCQTAALLRLLGPRARPGDARASPTVGGKSVGATLAVRKLRRRGHGPRSSCKQNLSRLVLNVLAFRFMVRHRGSSASKQYSPSLG